MAYSPWGRKESDMTEQFHFHCHPIAKVLAFVYLTINYGNNFLPLYYVYNTVFHYHTLEGLDCIALGLNIIPGLKETISIYWIVAM